MGGEGRRRGGKRNGEKISDMEKKKKRFERSGLSLLIGILSGLD